MQDFKDRNFGLDNYVLSCTSNRAHAGQKQEVRKLQKEEKTK